MFAEGIARHDHFFRIHDRNARAVQDPQRAPATLLDRAQSLIAIMGASDRGARAGNGQR